MWPFDADEIADIVAMHIRADRGDLADELMADDRAQLDGLLRPLVPIVDVNIGAADAGLQHLDENVVDAVGRLRHVLEPESGLRLRFHQCFH